MEAQKIVRPNLPLRQKMLENLESLSFSGSDLWEQDAGCCEEPRRGTAGREEESEVTAPLCFCLSLSWGVSHGGSFCPLSF